MQIDYFTIIAQIINFLVLVFLLRHFLYRPLLRSMADREDKISSRLKEAEQKKKEAEEDAKSSRRLSQEASEIRKQMETKAVEEARMFRDALMKEARDSVEANRSKWLEEFERQKGSLLSDLGRQAGEEIYAIIRRAIRDLADESLERQILNSFIRRLSRMDASDKEKMAEFYRTSELQITVSSTFEIPDDMRKMIEEIVHNQTGTALKISYRIAPELICGVEMSTHDSRIGWSIASYLNSIEADLPEALEESENKGTEEDGHKRR